MENPKSYCRLQISNIWSKFNQRHSNAHMGELKKKFSHPTQYGFKKNTSQGKSAAKRKFQKQQGDALRGIAKR